MNMTKNIDIYIPIDINIVIKSDIKKSVFLLHVILVFKWLVTVKKAAEVS